MFEASRQLFHRPGAGRPARATATEPAPEETTTGSGQHPAMRGLKVSPVHGHHCICLRCEQNKDAA